MKTRLLIALLLAVAIAASVFAIWPVVADAPWLDSAGNNHDEVLCQGALDYRVAILANPPTHVEPRTLRGGGVAITDQDFLRQLLSGAQNLVDRYC